MTYVEQLGSMSRSFRLLAVVVSCTGLACPSPTFLTVTPPVESTPQPELVVSYAPYTDWLECVGEKLEEERPDVRVLDTGTLWRQAFPEPSVRVPLAELLSRVSQAPDGIDYLIILSGGEQVDKGDVGSYAVVNSMPQGMYVGWSKESTALTAAVVPIRGADGAKQLAATAEGTEVVIVPLMAGLVFVPYGKKGRVCKGLGRAIAAELSATHDEASLAVALTLRAPGEMAEDSESWTALGWRGFYEGELEDVARRAVRGDDDALYGLAIHFLIHDPLQPMENWRAETWYQVSLLRGGPSGEAWPYLCRAAISGLPRAQVDAGILFESTVRARGAVDIDRGVALAWYTMAAAQGLPEGKKNRRRLEPLLQPPERARAERLIESGRPVDGCPSM